MSSTSVVHCRQQLKIHNSLLSSLRFVPLYMKISYLIFLSFLFILLLFAITTLINYNQYNEVQEKTDFLARSATSVREGNRYHRNILNLVGVGRGYLLTRDKSLFETFQSTRHENDSIFGEINTLLDDERQTARLAAIREL